MERQRKFECNGKRPHRLTIIPYGRCFLPRLDTSSLIEPVLQEQVEKLNRQNTEHSHGKAEADHQRGEDRGSGGRRQELTELILDGPHTSAGQSEGRKTSAKEGGEEGEVGVFEDSESGGEEQKAEDVSPEQAGKVEDDGKKKHKGEAEESSKSETSFIAEICKTSLLPQERYFCQYQSINQSKFLRGRRRSIKQVK